MTCQPKVHEERIHAQTKERSSYPDSTLSIVIHKMSVQKGAGLAGSLDDVEMQKM